MGGRISIEQGSTKRDPSKGPLIALGVVATVLAGFFAIADFSGADRATAEVSTSSSTSMAPVSTLAGTPQREVVEVDRALRSRSYSAEDLAGSDVEWVIVELPSGMTEVAGIGEFQGSVVVIGGSQNEAGLFDGLMMVGRSGFDTWFDVGVVTEESLSISQITFAPGAVVIVARSRPTVSAIRGDIVVLQSSDGREWFESRIADRNGVVEVTSVAVERQSITLFGVRQLVSDMDLADELSDAVRQLIANGSARAIGFDGQILLLGPFGIELARYPSVVVPVGGSTGELILDLQPTSWTSPIGGDLVETPSPFGGGIAQTISRNDLGDLSAQVFDGSRYLDWFSIGDGSWEHRSTYLQTASRGVGVLDDVSVYFSAVALNPRVLVVEDAVPYMLEFDRTAGTVLDVFLNGSGAVASTRRVTTERVVFSNVSSYSDGPTTIEVDRRSARITVTDATGVVYANEIYNITPSRVDLTNGRFMIAAEDGSDLLWIDLMLLRPQLDEDEIRLASGTLISTDLATWTFSQLPETVEVIAGHVSATTYLVVRRWVASGPEPTMILVADTP